MTPWCISPCCRCSPTHSAWSARLKQRAQRRWCCGGGGKGSRWMVGRGHGVTSRLPLATLLLSLLYRLFTLPLTAALPSAAVVRVNCGGSERVASADGREWQPDAFFMGGHPATLLPSVPLNASALGFPQHLVTQRVFHSHDISCYDIPLAPGRFIVRLTFAYHSDKLPVNAQREPSPPLQVYSSHGAAPSPLSASNRTTTRPTDSSAPRHPTSDPTGTADVAVPHADHSGADDAGDAGDMSAVTLDEGTLEGDADMPLQELPGDSKRKQRWPRFAVVIEGVQMETVSMAQHVGAPYEPEYIVDSLDASLTLCFLPVWGHAFVSTIEVLPVPPAFYHFPQTIHSKAFLAVRARIDCGSGAGRPFSGSETPSQATFESVGDASPPLTVAEGVSHATWDGPMNVTTSMLTTFNQSLTASVYGVAADGRGLMDAVGRRWESDLAHVIFNQEPAAPSAGGDASSSRMVPPRALHSTARVEGAGEAPGFLPLALLQTAREAVLASGLHYSFSFRIPARLNRWLVLLHFVAVQPESQEGERVFDVRVNGVTVPRFDILREAHGQHSRLVTLPVLFGFSRPAIGSAPTLEVQLVACEGSKLSPLVSSIEVIEIIRANVPRENVPSELQAQQQTTGSSQATPSPAPPSSSHAGVVAGAIGGAGVLVLLVLLVPLLLIWRRQHRRRLAMRSHLLEANALDSAAAAVGEGSEHELEHGGHGEEDETLVRVASEDSSSTLADGVV